MTDRPRIPQIPASEQKWSAKEAAMTDRDLLIEEIRAESARLRRERDEARAERDNLSVEAHHWMGEAVRYREALKRIAAFHHAPGKTYKAAWVESVRIAREALGGGDD